MGSNQTYSRSVALNIFLIFAGHLIFGSSESSCNLEKSEHIATESFILELNLVLSQKLIMRDSTLVLISTVLVSPYNMQFGVNLKVFKILLRKFL